MKFYRNSYTDKVNGKHAGSEWFGSLAEANRVWVLRHKSGQVVDGDYSVRACQVRIDTRKGGLVDAFNHWASHPCDEFQDSQPFEPGDESCKRA